MTFTQQSTASCMHMRDQGILTPIYTMYIIYPTRKNRAYICRVNILTSCMIDFIFFFLYGRSSHADKFIFQYIRKPVCSIFFYLIFFFFRSVAPKSERNVMRTKFDFYEAFIQYVLVYMQFTLQQSVVSSPIHKCFAILKSNLHTNIFFFTRFGCIMYIKCSLNIIFKKRFFCVISIGY